MFYPNPYNSLTLHPVKDLYCCGISAMIVLLLALMTSYSDVMTVSAVNDGGLRAMSLHKPSKGVDKLNLTDWLVHVLDQQFNSTSGYTAESPATIAGLFPSEVHVNFEGEESVAALKTDQVVADLSSLATLLTVGALLEASVKTPVEKVPLGNLKKAVDSLDAFRSPSFGEDQSALMAFWPVQSKGPPDKWTSRSVNVLAGGKDLNPLLLLRNAVTACKDKCPVASQALQNIQSDKLCVPYFNESLSASAKRYNFPPDLASTSANLALGVLLKMAGGNSTVLEAWKKKNANVTRLVEHVYQFAYQPVTSNVSNNVIDSRLYYVIEKYLSHRPSAVLENASFVTFWIPQKSPEGRVQYGSGVLPTYNTVDPFATATFLYAVTSAVLHGLLHHDNTTQTLVTSNLDLMTWIVNNNRTDSLDLLMTPHPSTFQFYWMLSRTMFELEKARVQNWDTYQHFQDLYTTWNKTVRRHMTEAILNVIQDGGLDGQGNPMAYVDDVMPLSAAADSADNSGDQSKPMGSDRLFSTASAANSLLAAWTVHNNKNELLFLPGTPADVALATKGLVNYVISKYASKDASLMNIIHSSIYKHCQSLPCYFPANSVVTKNGTAFKGNHPTRDILFGMRGQAPSGEYTAMLHENHYGHQTAVPLPGLQSAAAPFFFWSAPAYTQATCLLAVGQMKNVEGQVKSMDRLMDSFQPNR